jgi:hypothetical protein
MDENGFSPDPLRRATSGNKGYRTVYFRLSLVFSRTIAMGFTPPTNRTYGQHDLLTHSEFQPEPLFASARSGIAR